LSEEISKSQAYIDRVRANEQRGAGLDALEAPELSLGTERE
jgi:hypothetical protein